MHETLQIAKDLSTEVVALMVDGQEVCGRFFLAEHAPHHYGQENLLDLLNRAQKPFLPFALQAGAPPEGPPEGPPERPPEVPDASPVILLRKSRIVGLRPRTGDTTSWPGPAAEAAHHWPCARIEFGGLVLEGRAHTGDLPPERSRLADLLNHDSPFFAFVAQGQAWLINKNHLNLLVPLT